MPEFTPPSMGKATTHEAWDPLVLPTGGDVRLIGGLGPQGPMEDLAAQWGCPRVACPLRLFPSGEWTLDPLPNVANKDIVLVHDLGFWQKDALMGLGILSHGLAEEGAKTITLIVPYLPYGRQNGGKNGDGFHILHKILGAFPLHRVVTCDAHALHFLEERPGFFHAIPGAAIFFPHLVDQAIDLVVAPDQGAQGRAALLAKYLGCPWIGLSKIRDPQDESSVAIDCALPQRILNQRCVIIDDILDTGRTLAKSTTYLWQHGAKTVVACMTHGFFTQGALERIQSCGLKDLWISNSVPTFLQDQTGTLTIHRVCWAQALAGPLNR